MTINIQLTEAQISSVRNQSQEEDRCSQPHKYCGADDIYQQLKYMSGLRREHVFAMTLDRHSHIVQSHEVSIGTVDATLVHPREVFRPALLDCASGLLVVHNHPSGQVVPSDDDLMVTKRLVSAGKILGIELIDHIIIGKDDFYSFRQAGRLGGSRD